MALTRSEIRKIVEEEQVRKLIRKRRWDTDRLWEFFREKEEESVHLEGFWSRDLSRVIASGGVVGILFTLCDLVFLLFCLFVNLAIFMGLLVPHALPLVRLFARPDRSGASIELADIYAGQTLLIEGVAGILALLLFWMSLRLTRFAYKYLVNELEDRRPLS